MRKERIYSLDVLKILATVLIVFHHYQSNTGAWFSSVNFYGGQFYFGNLIEFFFVLSGFFVFGYIEKINCGLTFKKFYVLRIIRLLPLVAIAAIGYIVVETIFYRYAGVHYPGVTISLWGLIITSLGVQAGWVFADPCINGAVWYISVLLLCYIVFYLLAFAARKSANGNKKRIIMYASLVVVLIGIGIQTYGIEQPFFNNYTARGYYSFFFGIILAGILEQWQDKKRFYLPCILIVVGITTMIICLPDAVNNGIAYLMTFLYYPALIILFLSKPVKTLFCTKWIGWLAEISYNVYIWHTVFIVLMYVATMTYGIAIDHSELTMLAFTGIMFVIGTVSHFVIEKPITKMLLNKVNIQ